jgi:hypothetical protein
MCYCCLLKLVTPLFFPHAWRESEGARLAAYHEEEANRSATEPVVASSQPVA